jgi:hypothetical protein
MLHWFSSNAHSLSYAEYIMCKLFIIQTVNENSSILSLLPILSTIISENVCIIVYLYLFCVGSTHLHGIIVDGLLRKSYIKKICRYKRLKTTERWISKKNSFLHLSHTSLNQRVIQFNLEYRYRTDISHIKIQVLKSHG